MNRRNPENITDDELIRLAREGQDQAVEQLFEKYKGMVRGKARFLPTGGSDRDDMIQEGMIGLFKAIRDYDPEKDASFSTFANLCITRQLYTAVEASLRKKNSPLNTAVSLDEHKVPEKNAETSDGDGRERVELLAAAGQYEPESRLIAEENVQILVKKITRALSPLENRVLDLYLSGMNYAEIGRALGKSEKSVDNAMNRARTKLRSIL